MEFLEPLKRRKLIIVTGKGGVGKTVVSAVLGRALAAAGRRTLVVEVDPRENVHQMLGVPPSGGDIVSVEPRLWVQNLKPQLVLDEVVREQLRLELLARRVLESPVYQHFAAGAPGLRELAILGHALRLLRGLKHPGAPDLDTVVLDAPATGHGVALVAAPQLVTGVIRQGPFARMAGELAELIADPERCGIVVVTQAEEMPVEEVLELRLALKERAGRDAELLVINGLYPPAPPAPPGPPAGADNPLVDLWRHRRRLNERELGHLMESWEGPRVELPQLAMDRGPALVAALGRCMAPTEAGGARWS